MVPVPFTTHGIACDHRKSFGSCPPFTTFPKGITMRTSLRRALTLLVAAAAVSLGAATVASVPASAEPVCQAGTNWDGVLKICR
jgi:hypothetical protein